MGITNNEIVQNTFKTFNITKDIIPKNITILIFDGESFLKEKNCETIYSKVEYIVNSIRSYLDTYKMVNTIVLCFNCILQNEYTKMAEMKKQPNNESSESESLEMLYYGYLPNNWIENSNKIIKFHIYWKVISEIIKYYRKMCKNDVKFIVDNYGYYTTKMGENESVKYDVKYKSWVYENENKVYFDKPSLQSPSEVAMMYWAWKLGNNSFKEIGFVTTNTNIIFILALKKCIYVYADCSSKFYIFSKNFGTYDIEVFIHQTSIKRIYHFLMILLSKGSDVTEDVFVGIDQSYVIDAFKLMDFFEIGPTVAFSREGSVIRCKINQDEMRKFVELVYKLKFQELARSDRLYYPYMDLLQKYSSEWIKHLSIHDIYNKMGRIFNDDVYHNFIYKAKCCFEFWLNKPFYQIV